MRKFTTTWEGEVDLDNPKTYERLPNTLKELRNLMYQEIGYSYTYMNFRHKNIFDKCGQKERIEKFIKDFIDNESENSENIMWYQEQIFLFQDEIENMC